MALAGTAVHHPSSAPPPEILTSPAVLSPSVLLALPPPPTTTATTPTPLPAQGGPRGFHRDPQTQEAVGVAFPVSFSPCCVPLQASPLLAEGVPFGFSSHSRRLPVSPGRRRSDPEEFTHLQPQPGSGPSAASSSGCCGACA